MLWLIMSDQCKNNEMVHGVFSHIGQRLDHHDEGLNLQHEAIRHHLTSMEKKHEGQMDIFAGDVRAHADAQTTQTRRQFEPLQQI